MTAKLRIKRALGRLWGLKATRQRRLVLLYHAFGAGPFAMAEGDFRQQIGWLGSIAEILPLHVTLAGTSPAPLQASITFDDGYASLHSCALPILAGAGAVATAFLNTGWIGGHERKASDPKLGHYPDEHFLLEREVADLVAAGWEIGSHGIDHLDLITQPDDVVRRELQTSRADIEDMLAAPCTTFSYTWGRHNARLRRFVAEAGYTHAVAGDHGPITPRTEPFAIPRIDIAKSYSFEDFKAIVRGDWDYLGWLQRARARLRSID